MGRRDHRHASRRLDAYIDDELSPDDSDRVTSHLMLCDRCGAYVRFVVRVRAALLDLPLGAAVPERNPPFSNGLT